MAIGNNGDFFINITTGDIFAKVDGVWMLKHNVWKLLAARRDR